MLIYYGNDDLEYAITCIHELCRLIGHLIKLSLFGFKVKPLGIYTLYLKVS